MIWAFVKAPETFRNPVSCMSTFLSICWVVFLSIPFSCYPFQMGFSFFLLAPSSRKSWSCNSVWHKTGVVCCITLLCYIKCTCWRVLHLNILQVYFCKVLAIEQTTKKHFGMLQFKELYSKSLLLKHQVCATRNNIKSTGNHKRLIVVN